LPPSGPPTGCAPMGLRTVMSTRARLNGRLKPVLLVETLTAPETRYVDLVGGAVTVITTTDWLPAGSVPTFAVTTPADSEQVPVKTVHERNVMNCCNWCLTVTFSAERFARLRTVIVSVSFSPLDTAPALAVIEIVRSSGKGGTELQLAPPSMLLRMPL